MGAYWIKLVQRNRYGERTFQYYGWKRLRINHTCPICRVSYWSEYDQKYRNGEVYDKSTKDERRFRGYSNDRWISEKFLARQNWHKFLQKT